MYFNNCTLDNFKFHTKQLIQYPISVYNKCMLLNYVLILLFYSIISSGNNIFVIDITVVAINFHIGIIVGIFVAINNINIGFIVVIINIITNIIIGISGVIINIITNVSITVVIINIITNVSITVVIIKIITNVSITVVIINIITNIIIDISVVNINIITNTIIDITFLHLFDNFVGFTLCIGSVIYCLSTSNERKKTYLKFDQRILKVRMNSSLD